MTMISEKKGKEILLETYEMLFQAAIPSVSFYDLKNNCITYETKDSKDVITLERPLNEQEVKERGLKYSIDFYSYYVPKQIFKKIIDDQAKKYKIKGCQLSGFHMQTYLGCTPTSSKKRWLENHPESTMIELQKLIKKKYPDIIDEDIE